MSVLINMVSYVLVYEVARDSHVTHYGLVYIVFSYLESKQGGCRAREPDGETKRESAKNGEREIDTEREKKRRDRGNDYYLSLIVDRLMVNGQKIKIWK